MVAYKIRRALTVLGLLAVLALTVSGSADPSGPAIQVGSLTLAVGETGEIPMDIFNIPNGLQGIEVSERSGNFLSFDSTVIQVTSLEAVAPFTLDAVNIENSGGRVSFIARTPAGGPFPSSGTILRVKLQAVGGSSTAVSLSVTNLADGNNQPLQGVSLIQGTITIGESNPSTPPPSPPPNPPPSNNNGPILAKGDPDGDGGSDVIDARICLQIALGFIQPTSNQSTACDVNGDSQITLADAEEIAQVAIGQLSGFAMGGLLASVLLLITLKRRAAGRWLRRRALVMLPLLLGATFLLYACSGNLTLGFLILSHTSLAQSGYGTLTLAASGFGANGGLAAIEVKNGGLTFNPAIIHITGMTGLNGFTVLASVIDNNAGKVSFAAVNPSAGLAGGAIVQFSIVMENIGQSAVQIDASKLVMGDSLNNAIPVSSVIVGSDTISIP